MEKVRLEDVVKKTITGEWGTEIKNDINDIHVIRTADFNNDGTINYENILKRNIKKDKINEKKLEIGDIIVEKSGGTDKNPVGRVVFFNKKDYLCLANNFTQVIRIKENINSKYIFYNLLYLYKKGNTLKMFNKTTGIQNLQMKQFLIQKINLVSLNEQNKIVNKLDKDQEIIDLRKKQIEELDDFIKTQFVEMFENNDCETKKWQDVFNTTTGKLDSNAMIEGGIYPFFTCAKKSFRINEYAFDCEALLLAGNNAAGVYDVKHYKGKFNAYQRTYVLTLKNEKWKYELFKLELEEKLDFLKSQSKGSNTRYLTMKILNDLTFKVPDLNLQNKFAEFVKQINKQKFILEKTLKETEELQESLMNKYFS